MKNGSVRVLSSGPSRNDQIGSIKPQWVVSHYRGEYSPLKRPYSAVIDREDPSPRVIRSQSWLQPKHNPIYPHLRQRWRIDGYPHRSGASRVPPGSIRPESGPGINGINHVWIRMFHCSRIRRFRDLKVAACEHTERRSRYHGNQSSPLLPFLGRRKLHAFFFGPK